MGGYPSGGALGAPPTAPRVFYVHACRSGKSELNKAKARAVVRNRNNLINDTALLEKYAVTRHIFEHPVLRKSAESLAATLRGLRDQRYKFLLPTTPVEAPEASDASGVKIVPGTRVQLEGLKTAACLNGVEGVVVVVFEDEGSSPRAEVKLAKNGGASKRIKIENLRVLPPQKGDVVVLENLSNAKELCGRQGLVISTSDFVKSGRVQVKVMAPEAPKEGRGCGRSFVPRG